MDRVVAARETDRDVIAAVALPLEAEVGGGEAAELQSVARGGRAVVENVETISARE